MLENALKTALGNKSLFNLIDAIKSILCRSVQKWGLSNPFPSGKIKGVRYTSILTPYRLDSGLHPPPLKTAKRVSNF